MTDEVDDLVSRLRWEKIEREANEYVFETMAFRAHGRVELLDSRFEALREALKK